MVEAAVVEGRGWSRGALFAAGLALALWAVCVVPAAGAGSYPRLANIYFGSLGSADLEKLARWDLLVLSKRAEDVHQAELAQLRQFNSDITLIAHMAVGYGRDFTDPPINADLSAALEANNWWMKNTAGERVVFGPGNVMLNMTLECPTNAEGQRLCDWLPGYIAERLYAGGRWDGVFLDYCVDRIAWLDRYLEYPIDHDLDGQPAEAAALDESWRLGMRQCVSRLRELVGDDFLLVANGNNTLYDVCDGDTREDFPEMHGDWYQNMMNEEHGYLAFESLYRQPTTNIINTIWDGDVTPEGPVRGPEFDRELLFGLTSTLVFGSGYFSCDALDHSEMWWFEYYDVDLGEPLGRAEDVEANPGRDAWWVDLTELIKARRFENGIAVINPTLWIHDVQLGGAYYDIHSWNGQFYEFSGLRTHLTLGWQSGEVLVGTGVMPEHRIDSAHVVTGRDAVSLTWDPIDGAASYSIYRSVSDGAGGFGDRTLMAVVSQPSYTDRDLAGATEFRYYIAPINELKCEGRQSPAIGVSTEPGSDLSVALMVDELEELPAPGQPDEPGRSAECVEAAGTSASCALAVPVPQPASESALLSFSVGNSGRRGGSSPARLTVYDVSGRVVKRLFDGPVPPGRHTVRWDLTNEAGVRVASGCYLCVLEAGGERHTRKTLVIRG